MGRKGQGPSSTKMKDTRVVQLQQGRSVQGRNIRAAGMERRRDGRGRFERRARGGDDGADDPVEDRRRARGSVERLYYSKDHVLFVFFPGRRTESNRDTS